MCQKENNFLPYQKKQKFPKNVTFETEIMPKINTYIFNSSCSRNLKHFGNAFPMVEKMRAQF